MCNFLGGVVEWSSHMIIEHWYAVAWTMRLSLVNNHYFLGPNITSRLIHDLIHLM